MLAPSSPLRPAASALPAAWRRQGRLWPTGSPTAVVNGAARLIIAALIIAAPYAGRDLLIPVASAGILSFILFPLVRQLVCWGVPQTLAVAIVMAGLVAALFASMALAGREVAQLVEEVPRYETNLRGKAQYVHSFFGGTGIWQRAMNTLRDVEEEVRDPKTESKPINVEVAHPVVERCREVRVSGGGRSGAARPRNW